MNEVLVTLCCLIVFAIFAGIIDAGIHKNDNE